MYQVDIKEIDTQLATVIATALKGEDVLILQDQEPLLKLSRVKNNTKVRRKRGSAKGLVIMADDFDAPLEDFKEYMS